MVPVIQFRTNRFDPAAEDPNPINPIPGQALLQWLCGELGTRGYHTSEPDVEDWGWYAYVDGDGSRHLIGASGEPLSNGNEEVDWTLQIHRLRSLWEKLRGANQLQPDAPIVVAIEDLIRRQADFSAIHHEGAE